MEHDDANFSNQTMHRPPLRKFEVRTANEDGTEERHEVTAHLVFDNNSRGEGLVFRRYYDDSVRTEKVAQFLNWTFYKEISIV